MTGKFLLLYILLFLFMPFSLEGADWLFFFESDKGDKYYIDMESMKQTAPHGIRLSRKVEPGSSSNIAEQISDVELDCEVSRIRYVKERIYFKDGKTEEVIKDNTFRSVSPEDIDETLLELVCSLKKASWSGPCTLIAANRLCTGLLI